MKINNLSQNASSLQVRVITTQLEFAEIRPLWAALVDVSTTRSVFMTWEWMYAWWRHIGGESAPYILSVWDKDGVLVGLVPLCLSTRRGWLAGSVLSFMGTKFVSSEYLDILAAPGYESHVSSAIGRWLIEHQGEWDFLELSDLLELSTVVTHLLPQLRQGGYLAEKEPSQTCPYLPLPQDYDSFLNSLGSHFRAAIRRRVRKLDGIGVQVRCVKRLDEDNEALDTFYRLHEERWKSKGREGNFQAAAVRSFHCEIAEKFGNNGWFSLYRLEHQGRSIGNLYGYRYKDKFMFYQSGFDPIPPDPSIPICEYSPGVVLVAQAIQDCIKNEIVEFDFLRGAESYKLRWTDQTRSTLNLVCLPRARWGVIFRYQSRRGIKRVLKKVRAFVNECRSKKSRQ